MKILLFSILLILTTQNSHAVEIKNCVDALIQKIELKATDNLYDKHDQYLLDFSYGKLTETQFKQLHTQFGGHSKVPYESNRVYELIDFLSPLQQALVNKTFEYTTLLKSWGGDLELSDELKWGLKLGIDIFANCWNTSWQIARLNHQDNKDPNYYLYWPGRWEADDTLKDDKYSVKVEDKDIQPGDMLIISNKQPMMQDMSIIQHTAIFVSKDLIFEKTNGSKDDPFRISYVKDVFEKYRGIFEEGFSYEIRRFNKAVLPTPDLKDDDFMKQVRQIPGMEKHPGPLHYSVEIGMGGGNDMGVNGVLIFQVKIDPKTGRGVLAGEPQDLEKFKNLH